MSLCLCPSSFPLRWLYRYILYVRYTYHACPHPLCVGYTATYSTFTIPTYTHHALPCTYYVLRLLESREAGQPTLRVVGYAVNGLIHRPVLYGVVGEVPGLGLQGEG